MSEKIALTEVEKDALREQLEKIMAQPAEKGYAFVFMRFEKQGAKGKSSVISKGIEAGDILRAVMDGALGALLDGKGKSRDAGGRDYLEREGVKWN